MKSKFLSPFFIILDLILLLVVLYLAWIVAGSLFFPSAPTPFQIGSTFESTQLEENRTKDRSLPADPNQVAETSQKGWLSLKNSIGKYNLRYPSSWSLEPTKPSDPSRTELTTPEKADVEIDVEENENNYTTLEEWIAGDDDILLRRIISSREIKIAGIKANRREVAYSSSNRKKLVLFRFIRDNKLYSIYIGLEQVAPADQERILQDVEQVLGSLSFSP